jgi:hypothetical protein
MVFLVTLWSLALIPLVGCGVVILIYISFRLQPPGGPPQYILDIEKGELLAGREIAAANDAIQTLVEEVEEVTRPEVLTSVDDALMDRYRAYKSQCEANNKKPLSLSRWIYQLDPVFYQKLYGEDKPS